MNFGQIDESPKPSSSSLEPETKLRKASISFCQGAEAIGRQFQSCRCTCLPCDWGGSTGKARDEITVDRLPDDEVSPYLTQEVAVSDRLELRGPIGSWFVWRVQQTEPVLLVAGGSGIVPLMAMVRSRASGDSAALIRCCIVREPAAAPYRDELQTFSSRDSSVSLSYATTRATPPGWTRPPGRIDAAFIAGTTWPASLEATCYVCGPTSFVENAASLLTACGHRPDRIRTERFGPAGERKCIRIPTILTGTPLPRN
jgi:ferredoxin-NADP reductase